MNEMTPQISSITPMPATRKRSRRAKSTIRRIMRCLLLHRARELQRALHYFVAGLNARENKLLAVGRGFAGLHRRAAKLIAVNWPEHPILVVQPEDCGRGQRDTGLRALGEEPHHGKHPGPEE